MDKIPTIGGSRGIFEIFVPGVFLLLNLVATVYLLPFTDQITKEQMKELSTNPVLTLLLIVSFGYLAGIVLRLCRTEVTDRMSARVLRLYDTNARGGETPRNRYAYERFPYNKWLATLTERLPPQARDFYRSVWAGRSTRTFLNYCKVIVSAADVAAATEIYAAEALCRYISGMFYALATALFLLVALVPAS